MRRESAAVVLQSRYREKLDQLAKRERVRLDAIASQQNTEEDAAACVIQQHLRGVPQRRAGESSAASDENTAGGSTRVSTSSSAIDPPFANTEDSRRLARSHVDVGRPKRRESPHVN